MDPSHRQPLKAGQDSRKNWTRINEVDADVFALAGDQTALRRTVEDIQTRVGDARIGFHPFRLYNLPRRFRTDPDADDWRRIRVRSGRVIDVDADGTDEAADPDGETYPDGAAEVLVPDSTEKFYFWLEVDWEPEGTTSAVVRYGADPTEDSYSSEEDPDSDWESEDPWGTWPKQDGRHLLIGWVDTNSKHASKEAVVRQILRSDVLFLPGTPEWFHYRDYKNECVPMKVLVMTIGDPVSDA